ncbi:TipAS antibiotic-recognition domain-containing protein [Paenibacillus sp. F6_3S_P_1C]|uniref:TipAS antibiotic-recognition domain-containing protein n=1 Tax=Paenibacillus vandeheii TaxID=3035917 RepID=A0ABT8JCE5_9BACL|nr:TipAS antibiotic-recognition domain-containing protein [Paenibacillus vandeheii]MDN4602780.1 TipAS antibiotic-recognition domain-containing protein [Paenibacillus vandeheii]
MAYSMVDVSGMSGVSLSELGQYAETGLLNPAFVGQDEDIYYEKPELLRLQQILFCKEVGMEENEIGPMLRDTPRDMIRIMQQHRIEMLEKALHLHGMIQTLDKTISYLRGEQELDEVELYAGFLNKGRHPLLDGTTSDHDAKNDYDEHKQTKASSKHDVNSSEPSTTPQGQEMKSKEDYLDSQAKIDRIHLDLQQAIEDGLEPGSLEVQQIIGRHLEWIKGYYTPTAEIYRDLGNLYVEHKNFRQMYDGYHPKLAEFLRDGMMIKAEQDIS